MTSIFRWTPLPFSKHKQKTLPQIALSDPDWFFWAVGNRIFYDRLEMEVKEVAFKASNIKIPKPDPENWRVEYHYCRQGKSLGFSIIDAKTASYTDSCGQISTHLNLRVPRYLKHYDKKGGKIMLAKFRDYYFDGASLTKDRAERFFLDDRNFLVV